MASDDNSESEQVVARYHGVVTELSSGLRWVASHESGESVPRKVADCVSIHGTRRSTVHAEIHIGVVPEVVIPDCRAATVEDRQPVGPQATDVVGLFRLTAVIVKQAVANLETRAPAYGHGRTAYAAI